MTLGKDGGKATQGKVGCGRGAVVRTRRGRSCFAFVDLVSFVDPASEDALAESKGSLTWGALHRTGCLALL